MGVRVRPSELREKKFLFFFPQSEEKKNFFLEFSAPTSERDVTDADTDTDTDTQIKVPRSPLEPPSPLNWSG